MAICEQGCTTASACTGACQPKVPVSTGKRCRWCDDGYSRNGDEHWIVKSIVPAEINIRKCTALRPA